MSIYKITTQEELDLINADYLKHYPKEANLKWSGCNYYINQGNNEHEPLGTAQSMHDCEWCERFDYCEAKLDTPTWFWNNEIESDLKSIINEYIRKETM